VRVSGEFDFWVGEWDARWDGGHGTNTVTSELGGAVVFERFDGRPGVDLQGLSVSVFNGGEWRQTWVDSDHGYIDLHGAFADGTMLLHHERTTDDGVVAYRMVYTDIERDSFLWLWEREVDGEWETLWRIDYTRRRA
jgi:hypothetical protein